MLGHHMGRRLPIRSLHPLRREAGADAEINPEAVLAAATAVKEAGQGLPIQKARHFDRNRTAAHDRELDHGQNVLLR
jgi:hypothetical protein